ncbi:MAG TPA: dephospho-CoA kinase [Rhizomicrobium sp.]|nr:dephospho-CoA kinase [Rhizomicrobium sp.]
MARPFLIGLTGSIGMGKSETAKMFARLGIPVNDSDANVHAVYEPGGAAVPQIEKAFPGTVREGRVDRVLLSKALAADPSGFKKLEAIVHPLVAQVQQAFLAKAEADGADMVVLDIPLLFETGGHARMDAVVVVSAPSHIQRARVLERPGMTEDKLNQILSRQMPDEEKRAKAHYVVVTDKGLDHAFEQVQMIVKDLREKIAAEKKKNA